MIGEDIMKLDEFFVTGEPMIYVADAKNRYDGHRYRFCLNIFQEMEMVMDRMVNNS